MPRNAVYPAGRSAAAQSLKLSPGVVSGGHVYVTGMTGSGPDGTMPEDPEAQFRQAFEKIDAVLRAAGAGCGTIVDMTSYHVRLNDHFDTFCAVRSAYVGEPYPAWTAVEVAGLRRPGALVEVKVVAAIEAPQG